MGDVSTEDIWELWVQQLFQTEWSLVNKYDLYGYPLALQEAKEIIKMGLCAEVKIIQQRPGKMVVCPDSVESFNGARLRVQGGFKEERWSVNGLVEIIEEFL